MVFKHKVKPSRCIKATFASLKYDEHFHGTVFPTVLIITIFFLLCHPLQVLLIHYKSRIGTAIRGLYWMKMTMVNSGLKGLKETLVLRNNKLFCHNKLPCRVHTRFMRVLFVKKVYSSSLVRREHGTKVVYRPRPHLSLVFV